MRTSRLKMIFKREVRRTTQFRRDLRKAHKQGKDIALFHKIAEMLANDEPLPEKYKDHALSGIWKGYKSVMLNLIGCWFMKKRIKGNYY